MLGNTDDALDATQEALIAIARKIAHVRRPVAVLDLVLPGRDQRRARRGPPPEPPPDARRDRARAGVDRRRSGVDDAVADRLDVDAALAALPPEYRAAVALRDLVGLDYAEIAAVLGIPPGTVRSRIARGRAALADLLGNRDDAPGTSNRLSSRTIQPHLSTMNAPIEPLEPESSTSC